MCGRTNRALNREKMRNISLAFLAVPSWSLRRAVMRVCGRERKAWCDVDDTKSQVLYKSPISYEKHLITQKSPITGTSYQVEEQ